MKHIGEKVLGWFVVSEEEEAEVEERVVEELPPLPVEESASRPRIDPRVVKLLDLIASLPEGATPEVKRAIVVASLEAFGVSVAEILESAARAEKEMDRLDAEIAAARQLQEERAKTVAREKARLRAIASFFAKSAA